jgi:GntR family carbon starvation induced transcriptional regulator
MRKTSNLAKTDTSTTLGIEVFCQLRDDLKANRFKPGERLRFENMKRIYDVGVAPLREALSRLTEAGLVVQIGQKGYRVAPASLADLRDIVETRRFLEVRGFQEAVRHGGDDWEEAIVAAFHGFSKVSQRKPATAAERAVWEERHSNFHNALMSGCPSRWLLQLWSMVFDHAERYRRLAIEVGHWSDDELGDHKKLLDAALARDADKAGELLHQHIGFSAERLLARIGQILLESPELKADGHESTVKQDAAVSPKAGRTKAKGRRPARVQTGGNSL